MKMKKIIVTGMAFLTAMTVFAGCGSAGKEAEETSVTGEAATAEEDIKAAVAEEASEAGEDENQEVSISSGESLTIPVSDLTESAAFYPVNVDGTEMEVIAVKTSDGKIRTAFNTCQVCYDSGNGYYKQEGDKLVCQNCGNSFTMDQVGETAGGCNPWPILESDRTLADDEIQISYDFLKDSADIFSNWKGTYQS